MLQQANHWLFMGYSLVPFCLFTWDKWMKVFSSRKRTTHATTPFPSIPSHTFLARSCSLILGPAFLFTGVQVCLFPRPCVVLHLIIGVALHTQVTCATKRKAKKGRVTAKR